MIERAGPEADPYRTIGEVAEDLHVPQHVLRFWETRFPEIKPVKRAGGRRSYRPEDVALLRAVQTLLYAEGYTIKGVQRLLSEFGAEHVAGALARSTLRGPAADPAAARGQSPDGGPPAVEAGASRPPDGADVVACLEGVLAELSECRRLLSLL